MSDEPQNPFITPDNPLGSYNLPFEDMPSRSGQLDVRTIHDQISTEAAAAMTPLGPLAVLRLTFNSSVPGSEPTVITFVSDVATMKNTAELLHAAARRAAIAASMLAREAGR